MAFSETNEAHELDATRARFLEKTLADFRRHGAMLDSAGKEKLRAIDRELTLLTNRFAQNVLDDTNAFELVIDDAARLAGMPESALDAAADAAKAKGLSGFRLTLQAPSVTAVLTYADDPKLRETIWRAFNGRALGGALDTTLIAKSVEFRREKASFTGFRHSPISDRRAHGQDRCAGEGVRGRSLAKSEPRSRREQDLLAFRASRKGRCTRAHALHRLPPEKLKKARYSFDDEDTAARRVLEGAFGLAERRSA
jgi:oligopeptidase A